MSDAYFVYLVIVLLVGIVMFLAPSENRGTANHGESEDEDVDG